MSKTKWDTEIYTEYVNENHPEFEVRGEYTGNHDEVLMYHKTCGREFFIRVSNFKTRGTCSPCNRRNAPKTTASFRKEVFDLVGDEYTICGEYVSAKDKIHFRHNVCGNDWHTTPDIFLNNGSRCFHCFGAYKTHEMFLKEVFDLIGDEVQVLTEYKGKRSPVRLRHEKCGSVYEKAPEDLLAGAICPTCGLKARSGENHYRYNDQLTEEDRQSRDMQYIEVRKWRQKVYERDDYTCRVCLAKGGRLNAHHLNSWDTHVQQRFDVNNGVSLCVDCHISFHKKYGYGNNKKGQFDEYLNTKLTLF